MSGVKLSQVTLQFFDRLSEWTSWSWSWVKPLGHGNEIWMLVSGHYHKLLKVNDDLIWFEKFTCLRFSYTLRYILLLLLLQSRKKAHWLLGIIALCKGSVHNYANYANELFQNVFLWNQFPIPISCVHYTALDISLRFSKYIFIILLC